MRLGQGYCQVDSNTHLRDRANGSVIFRTILEVIDRKKGHVRYGILLHRIRLSYKGLMVERPVSRSDDAKNGKWVTSVLRKKE